MRHLLAISLIALLAACGQPETEKTMSVDVLASRVEQSDAPVILDVRTGREFAAGHIPGAINIPHTEVGDRLDELQDFRDRQIVVHCRSGKRAAMAEDVLRTNGFSRVTDLDGHMIAWEAAGYPMQNDGGAD